MSFKSTFEKFMQPVPHARKVNLVEKTFTRVIATVIFLAVLAATLDSLVISKAHAGGGGMTGGATEMTQIMNNTELAMQTVEQQLQTLESVEQTYLARLNQIGRSLGEYTAPFQRAYANYQQITDLQRKLSFYQGNLGNLSENLMGRYRMMAASKLDWNGYIQRERQLIADGNQQAIARIESDHSILIETEGSMRAYQQAARDAEKSLGLHQTLQINSAQLSMLGADLNRLIALTAKEHAARGIDDQERLAERQRKLDQEADLVERQRLQDKKTRDFINSLMKGK